MKDNGAFFYLILLKNMSNYQGCDLIFIKGKPQHIPLHMVKQINIIKLLLVLQSLKITN